MKFIGILLILVYFALTACVPSGKQDINTPPSLSISSPIPTPAQSSVPTQKIEPTRTVQPTAPPQIIRAELGDFGLAPELENEIWLNTEQPLRLENLRGKVVLIDMWTFG